MKGHGTTVPCPYLSAELQEFNLTFLYESNRKIYNYLKKFITLCVFYKR